MKEPETIFIEDKQPSLLNLPINMVATNLFEKAFGIGTDVICGKAMILDKEALLD